MLIRSLFIVALTLATLPVLRAQMLGTQFTWQGELRDAGAPATGAYDLEFRLHSSATGGSPLGPTNSFDSQNLVGGVHSFVLDFGDQFTGAPRWLEIAVRRSGQPGFTVLSPRTLVTPSPYALHAEFVGDDSVVSANIANGSITAADLGVGSVGSAQIVNAGIATQDLADGSVTTAKIADAAVTAAKLAVNSVGSAQINTSQVQLRIAARCPIDLPMVGIDIDAQPVCANVGALVPDAAAAAPRVALRPDGRPVLLYVDTSSNALRLVSCGDAVCATWSVETLDTNVGNAGDAIDVAIRSSGLPFVVYRDAAANALHAFDCADERCVARNFRSLDTTGGAGHGVSLAMRSGDLPIASYRVGTTEIRAYDCNNTNCTSGSVRTLAAVDVDGASDTALVLALGDVGTLFFEGSNGFDGLNAYNCLDDDCASGGRIDLNNVDVVDLSAVARSTSPQVAYSTVTGGISLFTCTGSLGLCPGGSSAQVFGPSDVGTSAHVEIALAQDESTFVVAQSDARVTVRHCPTTSCSSFFTYHPDPIEGRGEEASIVLRSDGRPVLAYGDLGSLRVLVCGNAGCAP